jgi:hypothetical protein
MSSSRVKERGEEIEKNNMINPYLNSVMACGDPTYHCML